MATASRALTLKLLADITDFTKGLDQSQKQVQSTGDKISAFGKKAGLALAAAGVAAGAFAVKFGKDAISAASDLNETIAKTGELFGDSTAEIEKFAESAASRLGQSKQQALDAAANFAIFGKSAGLAGSDLVNFSTGFTNLASDLASFNNTSPEDAINAIGSALRGEAEPLRRYGVLLNDASLRQAALELGIVSTTKNALTPQQKVLAAQQLIYEQTSVAQGDFARTSDGLANSQRILTAQIENVRTKIGTALLPAATELFGFIGGNLIPMIENWSKSFSESLGPVVTKLSNFIKTELLPIIQLWWGYLTEYVIPGIANLFTPILNGLFKAFETIKKSIVDNETNLRPLLNLFKAVATFAKDFLAPIIGKTLGGALQVVAKIVGTLIDLFSKLVGIINSAINAIKAIASAGKAIGGAIGGALGFGGGRANGGPVSANTAYVVGERGPELFVPGSSGSIIPNGMGRGTTINLTVNGAIDSESTARQIISILNDSQARGTLGSAAFA
jgi:phage-related protein